MDEKLEAGFYEVILLFILPQGHLIILVHFQSFISRLPASIKLSAYESRSV